MIWREVDKQESDILTEAARFECAFPRFYREASQAWTVDEDAVLDLYRSCEYLYGIWEGELLGLVYLQAITEWHKVAHLDAKRGADKQALLAGICRIRNDVFRHGVKHIQTWVLRQNRPLQDMLLTTGFQRTGLEMRSGKAHGRTLRWIQMTVREVNH